MTSKRKHGSLVPSKENNFSEEVEDLLRTIEEDDDWEDIQEESNCADLEDYVPQPQDDEETPDYRLGTSEEEGSENYIEDESNLSEEEVSENDQSEEEVSENDQSEGELSDGSVDESEKDLSDEEFDVLNESEDDASIFADAESESEDLPIAKSKLELKAPQKSKKPTLKEVKVVLTPTAEKSKKNKKLSKKTVVNPDDEYAQDSSDEEDLRNTIGNIPVNWYDECDHLGYDVNGEPILKPRQGDTMDALIERLTNTKYFQTVLDKQTGQSVELTDQDFSIAKRIMGHGNPDSEHNMYQPFPDLYSHEVMDMPISGRPDHKRSFLPVKAEREKVRQLASLIKQGIYKHKNWRKKKAKAKNNQNLYDIWKPTEKVVKRKRNFVAAPKISLPGPGKSYNPPPEYSIHKKHLTDKNASKVLSAIDENPKTIRKIPAYQPYFKEILQRLHDLYFGSRARYMKVQTTSSFFLPKLPSKHDLRPYPTVQENMFKGHRSIIRTISVHPNGHLLASGSDDQTVKIWKISDRRCLRSFEFDGPISSVAWNPNPLVMVLAVAIDRKVILLNPESYIVDVETIRKTNFLFKEPVDQGDFLPSKRVSSSVKWRQPTRPEWENGQRLIVELFEKVSKIVWHKQGDYFLTVQPQGISRSVVVHQLSKWRSQIPFGSNKGLIQDVQFHPSKSWLFVASQTVIRTYDLKNQKLIKKILGQTRWISSLSMHPNGEHFIIGTYDRQVTWFEFECTKRPHRLQFHHKAVRAVQFHKKYPMFASCSDDGSIIITHGTAYDGWEKDPLIIPLKRLYGHMKFDDLCALDIEWHPQEPTLFSAGADGNIIAWH